MFLCEYTYIQTWVKIVKVRERYGDGQFSATAIVIHRHSAVTKIRSKWIQMGWNWCKSLAFYRCNWGCQNQQDGVQEDRATRKCHGNFSCINLDSESLSVCLYQTVVHMISLIELKWRDWTTWCYLSLLVFALLVCCRKLTNQMSIISDWVKPRKKHQTKYLLVEPRSVLCVFSLSNEVIKSMEVGQKC